MFQDTKNLIAALIQEVTKKDFVNTIDKELNIQIDYFIAKGHNVNLQSGFIGQQILNDNDLFLYMYFRDLHFIYWGLKGNWQTFDKLDATYYSNLQRIVEGIFNTLK